MDALIKQWTQPPTWIKVGTILALPTSGFLTARMLERYHGWLALGPGGLPYSFTGYVMNVLLGMLVAKRETKSVELYEHPERSEREWERATGVEKVNAQKSFLKGGALPMRKGLESKATPYCAPQRERFAGDVCGRGVEGGLHAIAARHSDAVEWQTSKYEGSLPALFLRDAYNVPLLIARGRRELVHIHGTDMSAHLCLSLADAKEVAEKKWGERQRLSGSRLIPLGYLLLYIPRTPPEVEVCLRIVEAGVEYAKSNGRSG